MANYSVSIALLSKARERKISEYINKNSPCNGECLTRNAVCHIFCDEKREFNEKLEKFREELDEKMKGEKIMLQYEVSKTIKLGRRRGK